MHKYNNRYLNDNESIIRLRRSMGTEMSKRMDMLRMEDTNASNVPAQYITESKRLNQNTKVKSNYEVIFKRAFLEAGHDMLYEPLKLPVGRLAQPLGGIYSYLPDFMMPYHVVDGKTVIIEPHGSNILNMNYLKKMMTVREMYNVYLVLSTTSNFKMSAISEDKARTFVNELWYIEQEKIWGVLGVRQNMRRLMGMAKKTEDSQVDRLLHIIRSRNA
ncbi:MAG: hypothetical protein ACREBH_03730 [Candidatus Micrarchaeaceae archaeon]